MDNVDDELLIKMPIWRLVLSNVATYSEIENYWTFNDIMEGNEVLDIKEDIEKSLLPKMKGKNT